MIKLTKEQILKIPAMKKAGRTSAEIAGTFGVGRSTIDFWVNKLRKAGHKIGNAKKGVKAIDLTK